MIYGAKLAACGSVEHCYELSLHGLKGYGEPMVQASTYG